MLSQQDKVSEVGMAMAGVGGTGSIAAGFIQMGGGLLQMAGGATDVGRANVIGGSVNAGVSIFLGNLFVRSKFVGPLSASERATNRNLGKGAALSGVFMDGINFFNEGLQPHQASLPEEH